MPLLASLLLLFAAPKNEFDYIDSVFMFYFDPYAAVDPRALDPSDCDDFASYNDDEDLTSSTLGLFKGIKTSSGYLEPFFMSLSVAIKAVKLCRT